MAFYAVVFVVIIAGLAGIAVVVVRKFPQLSLIDTAALPLERDAKKKKAIIQERVSRMTGAFGRRIAAALTKLFELLRDRFRASYRKLLLLERQYRLEKPLPPEEAAAKIAALTADAEHLLKSGEYGDAEKRYIEVLSIDGRSADAYWGLGALYIEAKRYEQAKETYAFLVRMLRKGSRCVHGDDGALAPGRERAADAAAHGDIAAGYFDLGLAARSAGDARGARAAFERAVAFEPANPRHLDLLLDACILEGDKSNASEVFARFSAANPENNKLDSLAARIAAMPETSQSRRGRGKPGQPRM